MYQQMQSILGQMAQQETRNQQTLQNMLNIVERDNQQLQGVVQNQQQVINGLRQMISTELNSAQQARQLASQAAFTGNQGVNFNTGMGAVGTGNFGNVGTGTFGSVGQYGNVGSYGNTGYQGTSGMGFGNTTGPVVTGQPLSGSERISGPIV